MRKKILVVLVTIAFILPVWSSGQDRHKVSESLSSEDSSHQQKDSIRVRVEWFADQIIAGQISEEQFLALNLIPKDALEIFRHIGVKRGWKFTEEQLKDIVTRGLERQKEGNDEDKVLATGTCWYSGCAHYILQAQPRSGAVRAYPYAITSPINNECGPDTDYVFLYNTPPAVRANPSSVRYWHDTWYIRWVLSNCYSCGLGANGLCNTTTRVCMGQCPYWAGLMTSDLIGIYLWV